jgi:hypothetical protein
MRGRLAPWIATVILFSSHSSAASDARVSPSAKPFKAPIYRETITLDVAALGDSGRFAPPLVHLNAETRLARRFSLLLGTGFGQRARVVPRSDPSKSTLAWEAVFEPRWYLSGDFTEGFHLGMLTTFARVLNGPVIYGFAPPAGLALGPAIGVKSTRLPLIDVDVGVAPLLLVDRASAAASSSRLAFKGWFALGRSF